MKDKTTDLIFKISGYVFIAVFTLILSIIYYKYLLMFFPTETTFFIFPFDVALFIFGLTAIFITVLAFLLCYYFPKLRKKRKKFEKHRSL